MQSQVDALLKGTRPKQSNPFTQRPSYDPRGGNVYGSSRVTFERNFDPTSLTRDQGVARVDDNDDNDNEDTLALQTHLANADISETDRRAIERK